ncbi:hypothetical protein PRIPAC_79497, partial [Pristionchus pacificus]|uniref:G protein-coupled receptor n=1 Tax=Pristionchus pacificus TaxID=54126 RepID=A0A2A6CKD3_PRIPA
LGHEYSSYFERLSTDNRLKISECALLVWHRADFMLSVANTKWGTAFTRKMNIISEKTRNCHRRLMKSLIIQILIPFLTEIIPLCGLNLQYVDFPEFTHITFKMIGFHSIAHSLCLVLSTNFLRSLTFE